MSLPKFTIFEHRLEEKYTSLLQQLPQVIKALRLSNSLKDGDLSKIKKDVFNELWATWDDIDFEAKPSEISVQNQEFEFEKSVAADVMGKNVDHKAVKDYVNLYYAIYTIPYNGCTESLKYTTIYPKEQLYLNDHNGYLSLTIYAENPIEESAQHIKGEKDRILDMFAKNQEANEFYINTKEDPFKDAIDKEIDFHFKSGRDEISDNNLLL